MTRLRYSLHDSENEAECLAIEHVRKMALWTGAKFRRVAPLHTAPKSPNSKHPVVWVASFSFAWPDGVVVDGGDRRKYANSMLANLA